MGEAKQSRLPKKKSPIHFESKSKITTYGVEVEIKSEGSVCT